jgi:intein/homing endonuclease
LITTLKEALTADVVELPQDWDPRPDQMPLWKYLVNGGKRAVQVAHRRFGKDDVALHFACCAALEKKANYWHMLPEARQARKVIWTALNPKTGRRRIDEAFPTWTRKRTLEDEMLIEFINGSIWQLVGSDNYSALVGSPPYGLVFSEWSLANPLAWAYLSPILEENNGWALFIYCVHEDTMIATSSGLKRIKNTTTLLGEFTPYVEDIYGLGGFHKSTDFYSGGKKLTKIITTSRGYQIQCTPNHPLWTGREWKKTEDYRTGDTIIIQRNMQCWGDGIDVSDFIPQEKRESHNDLAENFLTLDFMYMLGLILAEGNWGERHTTITNGDESIGNFLERWGFDLQDDYHYTKGSDHLVEFLNWFGMLKGAGNKRIPDRLLTGTKAQISAFLSGYFDGDGSSRNDPEKWGAIQCDSISEGLIRDLQTLLLNYGIVSSISKYPGRLSERVKQAHDCYCLNITGYSAWLFYENIGFRLERKQKNKQYVPAKVKSGHGDCAIFLRGEVDGYPMAILENPEKINYRTIKKLLNFKNSGILQKALNDNFLYDIVESIEDSEGIVHDFVIPDTHSFFSNGFVSHNTPRGNNHGRTMLRHAEATPGWFASLLSADKTGVFSSEQLNNIQQDYIQVFGPEMGEALYSSEYLCSFDTATIGAYYSKAIAQARKEGRITRVPHDPGIEVDTWWDLGVDDSMSIWFCQSVGKERRLIDYYESSGYGLEHYAKMLKEKPYVYGNHFMPHDADIREMSSGEIAKSRKEVAENLGIRPVIVVPRARNMDIIIQVHIPAVRNLISQCWFDEQKCAIGLSGLEGYHAEYDEETKVMGNRPAHTWHSHPADSFRTGAVGYIPKQGSISQKNNDWRKKVKSGSWRVT